MSKVNYKKMKTLRIERGVPAQILTEVIGAETIATYYKKEKGMLRVSLEEAKKIADFYEMSIEEIFYAPKNAEMEKATA